MADLPQNSSDIAAQLARDRNQARARQSGPMPSLGRPLTPFAPSRSTEPGGALGNDNGSVDTSEGQQNAFSRLQGDRQRMRRARQLRTDKKQKAVPVNSDYPNPISFRKFVAFGIIAVMQDGLPLLFDLLGIGWIIEYCLLPITWVAYWYLIIRWTPKSLRKKFWQRTIMITAVGWIPVVGQFVPEWIATAIGAYIVIALYERGHANLATGQKSLESRGQGKKIASKVPDIKSSAAAQTLPR
jgi:hypothetical protein